MTIAATNLKHFMQIKTLKIFVVKFSEFFVNVSELEKNNDKETNLQKIERFTTTVKHEFFNWFSTLENLEWEKSQ